MNGDGVGREMDDAMTGRLDKGIIESGSSKETMMLESENTSITPSCTFVGLNEMLVYRSGRGRASRLRDDVAFH